MKFNTLGSIQATKTYLYLILYHLAKVSRNQISSLSMDAQSLRNLAEGVLSL